MSTYSHTIGEIKFTDKQSCYDVLRKIEKAGWPVTKQEKISKHNTHKNDKVTYEQRKNNVEKWVIVIPEQQYRNITYYLDELTENAKKWWIVTAITDGQHTGIIHTHNTTKKYDLIKWGRRRSLVTYKPSTERNEFNHWINVLQNVFVTVMKNEINND